MFLTPNTEKIAATRGQYIDDFQSLFRFHKIHTGKPEDLSRLATVLVSKQSFRSDFFGLAASISQRELGTLSDSDMLTVVALALGGPHIADRGEVPIPEDLLPVFTEGLREATTADEVDPSQDSLNLAASDFGTSINLETSASKSEPDQQPDLNPHSEAPSANPSLHLDSLHLDSLHLDSLHLDSLHLDSKLSGTLERLELNSIELKLYLAEIEQRISRIEPHLADITTAVHPPVQPLNSAASVRNPSLAPTTVLPSKPMAGSSPAIPARTFSAALGAAHLSNEVDVLRDADVSSPGPQIRRLHFAVTVLGTLLLLVLTGGGIFAYRFYTLRTDQQRTVASQTSGISSNGKATNPPQTSSVPTTRDTSPRTSLPTTETPGPSPKPSQPTVHDSVQDTNIGENVSAVPASTSPTLSAQTTSATATNQAHSTPLTNSGASVGPISREALQPPAQAPASPQNASRPDASTSLDLRGRADPPTVSALEATVSPSPTLAAVARPSPAPPVEITRPPSAAIAAATPNSIDPLFVPIQIMMRNARSTPTPNYPSFARFSQVEGTVLIQVLISKSGNVKTARVISGPLPLQTNALSAVRSWQFKPYLVDGKPVEVNTFVNFAYHIR